MGVPVQFSDEEAAPEPLQLHSPVRTHCHAVCPRLHRPSPHFKTAYGGSCWQLPYRFRYLLALKVAVHMWQRCAYDVTLQNAAYRPATSPEMTSGLLVSEWQRWWLVGQSCRKLLLLFVGSVCWRSRYLMCSLCLMLITLCIAKDT